MKKIIFVAVVTLILCSVMISAQNAAELCGEFTAGGFTRITSENVLQDSLGGIEFNEAQSSRYRIACGTVTPWILSKAAMCGVNLGSSNITDIWYPDGTIFSFSNMPEGFGWENVDSSGAKVAKYKYAWTNSPTYSWSSNAVEYDWTTGNLAITPEPGEYYLHLRAWNFEGVCNPLNSTFGPYKINSIPNAVDDEYFGFEDNDVIDTVTANDIDAEGHSLVASVIENPTHGIVSMQPDGNFTYSPYANWYGEDTFSYTVSDSEGAQGNTATVFLRIALLFDDIIEAKRFADNELVRLSPKTITAKWSDHFYIQDEDNAAGIRVNSSGAFEIGDRVAVIGTLSTISNGERCIDADQVISRGDGLVDIVTVGNKAVGGDSTPEYNAVNGSGQIGIKDAVPGSNNNVGLLVTTTGKVTAVRPTYFYVNDGSGARDYTAFKGVRIECGSVAKPPLNSFVTVTGISSIAVYKNNLYRVIMPRDANDIR